MKNVLNTLAISIMPNGQSYMILPFVKEQEKSVNRRSKNTPVAKVINLCIFIFTVHKTVSRNPPRKTEIRQGIMWLFVSVSVDYGS